MGFSYIKSEKKRQGITYEGECSNSRQKNHAECSTIKFNGNSRRHPERGEGSPRSGMDF